ncbi:lipase family protein [Microbulbifer guangxiensis]|uniref:lipase family protein n=1 Tax=Microbulbifer guangxiensis TaxID=2904249 RepID=UPI001F184EFE|nr:lipase family protein [Microbulbifer guangxiensis]
MHYFEGLNRVPGLPNGRAAYSDRMAYLGAELSRLVYEPFTPDASLTALLHRLGRAGSDSERKQLLGEWSARLQSNHCGLESGIRRTLLEQRFEPISFYDVSETQALLAQMDLAGQPVLLLCFRGTEMNAWDIVTDLKFSLEPYSAQGRVHRGFREAFERVRETIEADLRQHSNKPLFIFGHSLGGALALIATREFNHRGNGATYTYGAPRTGDRDYFSPVKTPIYRLEIGGDPVPLVPFGHGLSPILTLLRLIPLNGTLQLARWLRRRLLGYSHTGFRVFIRHAPNEPDEHGLGFRAMQVSFSGNIFWRVQHCWRAWLSTFPTPSDIAAFHSIRLYSEMLRAHMLRRNLRDLLPEPGTPPTQYPAARRAGAAAQESEPA